MKFVISYGLFDLIDNLEIVQPLKANVDGDVKVFPENVITINTKEECIKYVTNSIDRLWRDMEKDMEMVGLYDKSMKFWSERNDLLHTYWNDKNLIERSKWFARELKKYDFSSIYEVGMYNGRNLKYIHDEFPEVKIAGLDVNKYALDFAKIILPPETKLEWVDAANMDTQEKYDIVFTHGVLMHIPPVGLHSVIDNCIKKANKYIIHIERKGNNNYILRGPEKVGPEKVSDEFRWEPEIAEIYRNKGLDVTEFDFQLEDEKKKTTFTVVKL